MVFGGLGIFKLLQTFWGLAVLLSLGGYSLYQIAQPTEVASNAGRTGRSTALVLPTIDLTPRPTPIGGYPTPAPLTIFLACNGADGEAARFFVHAPSGYVVLRTDVDRELIVELLAGESRRFPAGANLIQTPCVRNLIRGGQLP